MSTGKTDESIAERRDRTSPFHRDAYGMIRRMGVRVTAAAEWQVEGHLGPDNKTPETRDVEPFTGMGFYSRPAPGSNAEAVVVFVGGSAHPIIVATRDEDARAAIAQIGEGETAMFNGGANATIILIKNDGTVEIRRGNGTAHKLVTQEQFLNHTHLTAGTGTPVGPTAIVAGAPALTGTDVLKGQ